MITESERETNLDIGGVLKIECVETSFVLQRHNNSLCVDNKKVVTEWNKTFKIKKKSNWCQNNR